VIIKITPAVVLEQPAVLISFVGTLLIVTSMNQNVASHQNNSAVDVNLTLLACAKTAPLHALENLILVADMDTVEVVMFSAIVYIVFVFLTLKEDTGLEMIVINVTQDIMEIIVQKEKMLLGMNMILS
jgi:hypothetical protein